MNIMLSFSEKQMSDLCRIASERNLTLESLILSCCLNESVAPVPAPSTSVDQPIFNPVPQRGERVSSVGGLFSFKMPVRPPVTSHPQETITNDVPMKPSLNMDDDDENVNEIVTEYESEEELNNYLSSLDSKFF